MISPALRSLRDALTACDEREPLLSFELATRTQSEANGREHWRKKAARVSKQRTAAALVFRIEQQRRAVESIERDEVRLLPKLLGPYAPGLVVRLVRIAPKSLDDDNLASALKAVRDGVADALGVRDDDKRVTWVTDQQTAGVREYAVRVEIYER